MRWWSTEEREQQAPTNAGDTATGCTAPESWQPRLLTSVGEMTSKRLAQGGRRGAKAG